VCEIKISFLRNDARDTPVTIHVGPQDASSLHFPSLRDGKGGPDPSSKDSAGTPLESRIRRTYADAGGRSVIVLFTTLGPVR